MLTTDADLDSLTSSLLFAYLRSLSPPTEAFSPFYVPVLNIPQSAVRLRPEFDVVCRHAGIKTKDLMTLDHLVIEPDNADKIRFMLVDHNRLTGQLSDLAPDQVIGVIDHHDDEQFVPSDTKPEPRLIEKAGSCTSLVIRYCKPTWDAVSSASVSTGAAHGQGESAINDSAFTTTWDAQIAKMALASVLIDTANLTAPGKVEVVDREAVDYLEARIMLSPTEAKSWHRDQFYEGLQEAKTNIDGLTLEEILAKDYKQWTENDKILGMSSVVKDLEYAVGKANEDDMTVAEDSETFAETLGQLMFDKGLDVFAIMTASTTTNGDFRRELLLQARPGAHEIVKSFVAKAEKELGLDETQFAEVERRPNAEPHQLWRNTWKQNNVSRSRKQVAPLLRQAMQQVTEDIKEV